MACMPPATMMPVCSTSEPEEAEGGGMTKQKPTDWPPKEYLLPDLETLERLSWPEDERRQLELFEEEA